MDTKDCVIKWFVSGDTGVSSKAIVAQMTGNSTGRNFSDYPRDNGDFGRCYRLLEAVPEFRARIGEMAERSKQWASLVARWDELERLHETDGSACYELMKEALKTSKDPRCVDIGSGVSLYT